jgi:hypothetical protein
MRQIILLFFSCITTSHCLAQSGEYIGFIRKADSLYKAKDYVNSARNYSLAFKANGWKGTANDRYNAACSWALTGNSDSAFYQLERIATKAGFSNYDHLTTDTDLNSLHSHKRWAPLLQLVKQNKEKAEANLNRPLANQLDSIYNEDQKYRLMMADIEKKYGFESEQMKSLWKTIQAKDSVNLIRVTTILDKYGWLGPDVVGNLGSNALFLVIQHADQKTQEKYLPMMREAVKNGKAYAGNLALLEDRVALGQGKKQIYGSQIHRDNKTGKYFVAPIEDEANVNVRRAAVGLGPLEEYAKNWDIDYKVPKK